VSSNSVDTNAGAHSDANADPHSGTDSDAIADARPDPTADAGADPTADAPSDANARGRSNVNAVGDSGARSNATAGLNAGGDCDRGPGAVHLERDYGLSVSALVARPGGFESECWLADGTWFIKVWRNEISPAAAPDAAPGRLGILRELQALGLPVPAPVPTISGGLHATWNARSYAVFPYIEGRPATDADWRQSARALRQVHDAARVPGLPVGSLDESDVRLLATRLDHPWIADRRDELAAAIDRLDDAVRRAEESPARRVLCHTDFTSLNLIVDSDDQIAAILDWDQAVLAPREHDLWIAAETRQLEAFLTEYGARDLNLDHLEYALLSRALRDLTARVLGEVDRPGVQTWGFDRLDRLDDDLARFRTFCADL
jgi:hypothetical protein